MKRIILMLVTCLGGMEYQANAQFLPVLQGTTATRLYPGFYRMEVHNDINVVLTNDPSGTIEVQGDPALTKQVTYRIKNGILSIRSVKGSLQNRVTVRVPVEQLREMELYGTSTAKSHGALHSPQLHVRIHGAGKVNIRNQGYLYVDSVDDVELVIEKWATLR